MKTLWREFLFEMFPDIKDVKMFKAVECCEAEKHQGCDDFTFRHLHGAVPVHFTLAGTDPDVFELSGKFPAEIVRNAENSDNFVQGKHAHNILLFNGFSYIKITKTMNTYPAFFVSLIPNSGYYIATESTIRQFGPERDTPFFKNPREQITNPVVGHVRYWRRHGNKETIPVHSHMPFYSLDFLIAVNAV
jgi:hypothetical protein